MVVVAGRRPSMSLLSNEPVTDFTRKFLRLDPNVLLESRCEHCGLSIIAEDAASLRRDELEHRKTCNSAK